MDNKINLIIFKKIGHLSSLIRYISENQKGSGTVNIYLVYQKYHKDFLYFAKSLTKGKSEAFDLVQDAYVSGIERETIFKQMNEYQIKGWFFTTIKNKNIDNIRKNSRNTYEENIDNFTRTETFEQEIAVKELILTLPNKYRKIIILRYEMNLNSREIGEILSVSPSTVRSQISKALKILRKNL